MEYRILFTIYTFIFVVMLLMTYFQKQKEKNIRSKLFGWLIVSSIFFAIVEIMAIALLVLAPQQQTLFIILWKARNVSIWYFLFSYVIYFMAIYKNYQYKTVTELVKDKKIYMIALIMLGVFTIVYHIFGKVELFDFYHYKFVGGRATLPLVISAFACVITTFVLSIKLRKTKPRIFINYTLTLIIAVIVFICQFLLPYESLLPFLSMFILFVFYYNVENPDLKMIDDLKNNIDKSSNAKLDFLFNLSYDLINPMNAIVSLSDSLTNIDTFSEEETKEQIRNIKYAGNTLLDSIDNILDLSKNIEDENQIIEREYSTYELFKRMEAVAKTRIGAKQIEFELDLADNINSRMIGDINKIQKILLNLITNAVKFTEVGRIKLVVTCSPDKLGQILHIKVSDTGNGISDQDKSFIFSDSTETSGVGLALSKKYVEQMNGSISFDTVYGAGTTFYVNIPQQVVGTSTIKEDKENDQVIEINEIIDCSNFKALIVDDDVLDVKVTTRLLEKYKLQITTITNPLECLDRIKREEQFDIMFLDHKMQELNGMELMKLLRGLEGYNLPKIVALTANAVAGAREYYLNEGFDEYLSKPIDTQELDKIIAKFFKNKQ